MVRRFIAHRAPAPKTVTPLTMPAPTAQAPTAQPRPSEGAATPRPGQDTARPAITPATPSCEIGGPEGPEPTRYGDWERKGICVDF